MKRMSLAVLSCLAISASAYSADPVTDMSVTRNASGATVQGVAKVTATIVGIDPATRTVTLKAASGKVIELEVTKEARNFDQLKIGDVVNAGSDETAKFNVASVPCPRMLLMRCTIAGSRWAGSTTVRWICTVSPSSSYTSRPRSASASNAPSRR